MIITSMGVQSFLMNCCMGLNDLIFFNAHFLSVNVFQGEGGVVNELFLFTA